MAVAVTGCGGMLRMEPPEGFSESVSANTGANPFAKGAPHVGQYALETSPPDKDGFYGYRLRAADSLEGRCQYKGDDRPEVERFHPLIEAGIQQKQYVACSCGDASSLVLQLAGGASAPRRLEVGSRRMTLQASHRATEGRETVEPAGFIVMDGAQRVAAVEVLDPGHIWLSEGVTKAERGPLICALTGLMLAPLD